MGFVSLNPDHMPINFPFCRSSNWKSAAAAAKSLQSCPTLCDPIDSSPPSYPIPGILQAITLEWDAISFSSAWKWKVKVKSLSRVRLSATPWTAAYQAPLSMGFSRREYWSGVPLPSLNWKSESEWKSLSHVRLFVTPCERVTGRKARGLQTEEISCKCQTFLSLLSGMRKQTSNIYIYIFSFSLYKFKRRFLLKCCVAMTPGFTWSQLFSNLELTNAFLFLMEMFVLSYVSLPQTL